MDCPISIVGFPKTHEYLSFDNGHYCRLNISNLYCIFWEEVARRRRLLLVLWTGMMAWTL